MKIRVIKECKSIAGSKLIVARIDQQKNADNHQALAQQDSVRVDNRKSGHYLELCGSYSERWKPK